MFEVKQLCFNCRIVFSNQDDVQYCTSPVDVTTVLVQLGTDIWRTCIKYPRVSTGGGLTFAHVNTCYSGAARTLCLRLLTSMSVKRAIGVSYRG